MGQSSENGAGRSRRPADGTSANGAVAKGDYGPNGPRGSSSNVNSSSNSYTSWKSAGSSGNTSNRRDDSFNNVKNTNSSGRAGTVSPDDTGRMPRPTPNPGGSSSSQTGSSPQAPHHRQSPVVAVVLAVVIVCVGLAVAFGMPSGYSGTDGILLPIENPTGDGVEVRDSLEDYSWSELSQIAGLMEDSGGQSASFSIAEKYNLVTSSGTFTDNTKAIQLSDGTTINMRLVGIWHDDLASGSGKAGMSFISTDVAGTHRAASATVTDGGWAASELRTYLNQDVYAELPTEVQNVIVPVLKESNNLGKTTSTSDVTQTTDTLWLPSVHELAGDVNWTYREQQNASYYNDVFNAEGTQYEYYAQQGVATEGSNPSLALGEVWWLRSTGPSTGRGRYVDTNGDPSTYGNSNDAHGVVVGFCL